MAPMSCLTTPWQLSEMKKWEEGGKGGRLKRKQDDRKIADFCSLNGHGGFPSSRPTPSAFLLPIPLSQSPPLSFPSRYAPPARRLLKRIFSREIVSCSTSTTVKARSFESPRLASVVIFSLSLLTTLQPKIRKGFGHV